MAKLHAHLKDIKKVIRKLKLYIGPQYFRKASSMLSLVNAKPAQANSGKRQSRLMVILQQKEAYCWSVGELCWQALLQMS